MSLVNISEVVVDTYPLKTVLDDLALRHQRLADFRDGQIPRLFYTLGSADVVEILRVNDFFPMVEAPVSSGYVFRRATGAVELPGLTHVHADPDSKGVVYETKPLAVTLDERGDLPLFAVFFLKIAPWLKIAAPVNPDHPLAERAIRSLFEPGGTAWPHADLLLQRIWPERASARVTLTPLVGLDAVELILVMRASRLEPMGALLGALRLATGGDLLGNGEQAAVTRFLGSLGLRNLAEQDLGEGARFVDSHGLVGVEIDRDGDGWATRVNHEDDTHIAHDARLLVRAKYPPGSGHAARERLAELLERPYNGYLSLGLTDFWDVVGTSDGERSPLTAGRFARLLHDLAGTGGAARTASISHLAFPTGSRVESPAGSPDDGVRASYDADLLAFKKHALGENTRGILEQWKESAKEHHFPYALTNAVINAITSVLSGLATDLQNNAEVLRAMFKLVAAASTGDLDRVRRLYGTVESIIFRRGRRDNPFQPPSFSLAFACNAGHGVAREAFVAFVREIERAFGEPEDTIIVDIPHGENWAVRTGGEPELGLSALDVWLPLGWVQAHEVAHLLRLRTDKGGSDVARWLRAFRHKRWTFTQAGVAAGEPAAELWAELEADLALWWHLFHGRQSPDHSLFLFVLGPAVVSSLRSQFNPQQLEGWGYHLAAMNLMRVMVWEHLRGNSGWNELLYSARDAIEEWVEPSGPWEGSAPLAFLSDVYGKATRVIADNLLAVLGTWGERNELDDLVEAFRCAAAHLPEPGKLMPIREAWLAYLEQLHQGDATRARPWVPCGFERDRPPPDRRGGRAWMGPRGGLWFGDADHAARDAHRMATLRLLHAAAEHGRSGAYAALVKFAPPPRSETGTPGSRPPGPQ